ncbi:hypothetical protein FDT80_13655 [Sulfitobacter sabulilitoris]|uniref:Permease n=2 Tax=Sulfitobacter sabulilitoris TaxID=2562655 RepID=A0A5S3PDE0_9RHOB|nr:hypothetical protein FDT80_13655 [Sulfitobacter sabulilitoris]
MMGDAPTMVALWWAVVASGVYHGVNPGMGWPLTVSAALMEGRRSALAAALAMLALGHFLAMSAILLPFSAMIALVEWQREIRIAAGGLVMAIGAYLLINRRHPRFLARVKPSRLALWSFLAAMAHGAGFMLLPIYLGLCGVQEADIGHRAAADLMADSVDTALTVAAIHTAAMSVSGGVLATVVYAWLGLRFLSKAWFNIDVLWALSLVLVGGIGVWAAL